MSSGGGGWSSRRSKPVKLEKDVVDLGATFGIALGSDSDSSDAEFAPEHAEKDSADSESGGNDSSGEGDGNNEEEKEKEEGVQDKEVKSGGGKEEKREEKEAVREGETVACKEGETAVESEPTQGDKNTTTAAEVIKKAQEIEKDSNSQAEPETTDGEKETVVPASSELTADDSKEIGSGSHPAVEAEREQEYNPLIVRRSNRAIKPTKDVDLYLLGAKFGIDVEESGAESSDMEFAPADDSPDSVSMSSDDDGARGKKKSNRGDGREEEDMEVGEDATTLQQKAASEDDFSRSVSEFSINQEAAQQVKMEIQVSLCAVCLEDSLDGDIVECDHCGISVHEGCYGVPEEDGVGDDKSSLSSFTTIPWFCDTCKAGMDPATCSCELCPKSGGLYKQATNGRWVHMVCSLYTPGIEYVEPTLLSGVTLDCVSASRWGAKRCQLCEDGFYSKTGVCIGCDAGLCKGFFHATCAQQNGLLCEMDSDEESKDVVDPYFAHCKAHADKTIAKRKRRDYLTVANKQKKFKFDKSNDRILHYLGEARKAYTRFFKKMINYYRPELTVHFEDRLLHFQPSALKRLTRKAQLLGFTVEVDQGGSRRKIAPDMTTEFVNHFNERQNRQKEMLVLEKKLTASHVDLREQELKMKHQVARLEKELNSLQVRGQELKRQVTSVYSCLGRISGEQVTVPEAVRMEGEGEEEDGDTRNKSGLPVCTVCCKFEDSHLMALCDTCERHYHITCLDPPLSRVPKKTSKWGWQCHRCCFESGDDMVPTIASFDEPASRCGRKINAPKVFTFPEDQVKQSKKSYSRSKSKTKGGSGEKPES